MRDYLKRETQTFFGVQRDNEREQRRLWHERRRRHAARALGDLRLDLPPDHHPDVDDIRLVDCEFAYKKRTLYFKNDYLYC